MGKTYTGPMAGSLCVTQEPQPQRASCWCAYWCRAIVLSGIILIKIVGLLPFLLPNTPTLPNTLPERHSPELLFTPGHDVCLKSPFSLYQGPGRPDDLEGDAQCCDGCLSSTRLALSSQPLYLLWNQTSGLGLIGSLSPF